MIISIEGNIGSGKTTLLKNLKEYYKDNKNIIFLKEPVDDWSTIIDEQDNNIIEKFYADQEKYSFSFQMMAYISRLAILKEVRQNNPDSIIITERSLHTDKNVFAKMLFDDKKIELINYRIYLKWFDTFASEYPIKKIIYVKTDPKICSERINKRSRSGENNIPISYLINCDKYHNDMLDIISCERLVLDGNKDIFIDNIILENWINQIDSFIK
jgi:deoxyguanosine kinase